MCACVHVHTCAHYLVLVQMHICHSAHVEVRGHLECQSTPFLLLKIGTLTISPVYTRSAGSLTSWISLFPLSMSPEFRDCRCVLPCLVSPVFQSSSPALKPLGHLPSSKFFVWGSSGSFHYLAYPSLPTRHRHSTVNQNKSVLSLILWQSGNIWSEYMTTVG